MSTSTLLDVYRATGLNVNQASDSAIVDSVLKMLKAEYARGLKDGAASVVVTDNSDALAEIERLKPLAAVGASMVKMTTTVWRESEWPAIPELWLMCMKDRDEALAEIERLTECLNKANGQTELYERKFYLSVNAHEAVLEDDLALLDKCYIELLICDQTSDVLKTELKERLDIK
jgi:hypothetical protein